MERIRNLFKLHIYKELPQVKLRTLNLNENKQDKLFASTNCQQLLAIYDKYYLKNGFDFPWIAYLIIEENQVLGTCSFTGKPKNGTAEIAYWTFKEFEGNGVASFACKELISIAKKENPKILITAKTAPETNASTRILEKNGFTYSKIVQDEEIGEAWLWILE